jgi:hypothetical protein
MTTLENAPISPGEHSVAAQEFQERRISGVKKRVCEGDLLKFRADLKRLSRLVDVEPVQPPRATAHLCS